MMEALERIALEAQGIEQEQQAAEDAFMNPEQQPGIDPALAWAQIPKMFGGILGMAFPELEKVYSDEKCMAWGGAMAQVAEKYQWDAAETMAKYGPEIALTIATLPLAIPTVQVIRKALDKTKNAKPIDGDDLVKPAPPDQTEGAAHVQE